MIFFILMILHVNRTGAIHVCPSVIGPKSIFCTVCLPVGSCGDRSWRFIRKIENSNFGWVGLPQTHFSFVDSNVYQNNILHKILKGILAGENCSSLDQHHTKLYSIPVNPGPLAGLRAFGARFRAFGAQLYFYLSSIHREWESPYLEIYKLEPLSNLL